MKHSLTNEERKALDRRVAEAEKRTGAQIVLAVIGKSDTYAELPWKAFALGASVAGLLALSMSIRTTLSSPVQAAFLAIVMILSAGAGFALLAVLAPNFARLFLSVHRAEAETRQYAESLFLSRQLFATRDRRAVLLMVSLFERQVVVLPDTGLVAELDETAAGRMIASMRPDLTAGRTAQAFMAGLKSLEDIIPATGASGCPDDALPDDVIEEKGP